jgi:ABC-type bacteriocin/lantibiotic exporter with double-glycine peptidase domain
MRRAAPGLILCLCLCTALTAATPPGIWLDVPFVKQEKNGCGSASIAMVMQYWQAKMGQRAAADARSIQRELYSQQGHGIYASDLEAYLRGQGYRVFGFQGRWQDFQEQLAKGRPLIVALKTGRQDLHYAVIAGVDPRQNVVLENDPAERKLLKKGRASFEKEWRATGNWTLLAVPEQDGPGSPR